MGNELTETLETAFWKDFHIVFWNNYETRKVDQHLSQNENVFKLLSGPPTFTNSFL